MVIKSDDLQVQGQTSTSTLGLFLFHIMNDVLSRSISLAPMMDIHYKMYSIIIGIVLQSVTMKKVTKIKLDYK